MLYQLSYDHHVGMQCARRVNDFHYRNSRYDRVRSAATPAGHQPFTTDSVVS